MLDNPAEFSNLLYTVTELAKADGLHNLVAMLVNSQSTIVQSEFDNWNGGSYGYTVNLAVDVKTFISIRNELDETEKALLDRFKIAGRHFDSHYVARVSLVPKTYVLGGPMPNPHRPFTLAESKRRLDLSKYLDTVSEDELTMDVLLPLFRQIGYHRITSAGHKDKALEYGKDIWMKYTLPSQHILYFGIQVKKGKMDSSGVTKSGHANVAEVYNQVLMMLGHEIFDPEVSRTVLIDHAFIIAGGEITKAAKNWIGGQLDKAKRSQIMFMDRDDILNLYIVTNLPLPSNALPKQQLIDDLPF